MRIIQMLLLIFALAGMPVISSGHTVSATMLVSINVIPVCSVNTDDGFSEHHNMSSDDIHCAGHHVHRISHHREHSQHQRHHRNMKHDQDDIELTTIEF